MFPRTIGRRDGGHWTVAEWGCGRPKRLPWPVALSRDGRRLVIGRDDGMLSIWDAKTLEQFAETAAGHHNGMVSALDVSPDLSRIASASHDGTIILSTTVPAGRRLSGPLPLSLDLGLLDWVSHLQSSPTGDRLAACYDSHHGTVYVWDV